MGKVLNISKWILGGLGVIIAALAALDPAKLESVFSYTYLLMGGVILTMVVGALYNFIENPKSGLSFIVGLLVLALVIAIAYGSSTEEIDPVSGDPIEGSRLVETGLYTLYTVIVLAVAGVLFSSVKRIFS